MSSARPFNFSAGPATMPLEVLLRAGSEIANWHDTGMGVMEMSHRGAAFGDILARTLADIRDVLAVPTHFHIVFMQGGGLAHNAIVPMNLLGKPRTAGTPKADFIVSGSWSHKSSVEAKRYADAHVAFSGKADGFTTVANANAWHLRSDTDYVHLCSNETIDGIEFHTLPDLAALGVDAPLVVDCSSHVASRPMEWHKIGVAFAGAQKNLGPAGVTLAFVREDLCDQAMSICPSAFEYKGVAANNSMFNTPPTNAIYMVGLVFEWLKAQGGLQAIEANNIAKAALLYDAIDASGLYSNHIDTPWRSRMNVPFKLANASLNDAFLAQAKDAGLLQLKGHKSVGGMRASIYNAMPLAGVQALVDFMHHFERTHA
ncbi:MAG: 3-phosphoserine/phosphohydroxythreonine transaminase [Burkholderiaceae bacterium]|nr:3-phosphoserine/phosphohydroxythreonine transaminase [Burkholderiaceae bacterium]